MDLTSLKATQLKTTRANSTQPEKTQFDPIQSNIIESTQEREKTDIRTYPALPTITRMARAAQWRSYNTFKHLFNYKTIFILLLLLPLTLGNRLPPQLVGIYEKEYNSYVFDCDNPLSIDYIDKEA